MATDNFNRANGALGSNWTAMTDGAMTISSSKAVGTGAAAVSGNYRTGEAYTADQYSEVTVDSTPANGHWVAPTVRNQSGGDVYMGLYAGAPSSVNNYLQIFKRISGTYTGFATYVCGVLPVGTKIRLEIAGGTMALLQDGVLRTLAYDSTLASGPPGIAAFGIESLDNWDGNNLVYDIKYFSTDGNGVETYYIVSRKDGKNFHTLRVLRPTSPTAGKAHHFLYVLPVMYDVGGHENDFGDGFDACRLLNAHNSYNVTLVAPSFQVDPWYADHATDSEIQYESFMVSELRPWVVDNLSTTGSERHWLLGFSKSAFGGIDLMLKHQDLFSIGAFWDFPAQSLIAYDTLSGMTPNYGTDANFQANYRMTNAFLDTYKSAFQSQKRFWIDGYNLYQADVSGIDTTFTSKGILHTYTGQTSRGTHNWNAGWLPAALVALDATNVALSSVTVPISPGAVNAQANGPNAIDLAWAPTGATNYIIERKSTP